MFKFFTNFFLFELIKFFTLYNKEYLKKFKLQRLFTNAQLNDIYSINNYNLDCLLVDFKLEGEEFEYKFNSISGEFIFKISEI